MKLGEIGMDGGFAVGSISRGDAPVTLAGMEAALIALRDLEWRAPAGGRSLGGSPFAKDGPWHLAQREVGDIAGEYSETLLTNEAGKELLVRKLDTPRPRTPLRVAEVALLDRLRGWIELLTDPADRRIIWEGAFHLWRGEPMDWAGMKRRIGYPHSAERLARRYREALAKLVCRVNGVPVRHHRALLARDGALPEVFNRAARQESLGLRAVKP